MVLTNTNEASIFTPASEVEGFETVMSYITTVLPRLPPADAEEVARLYGASASTDMHQLAVQIKSDCE